MTEPATTTPNQSHALRSLTYASFVAALDYPGEDLLGAVRGGDFAAALRQLLDAVDPAICEGVDWSALHDAGAGDETLMVEYTRLFLAGEDGPACGLDEGSHLRSSEEAMEETLRFYQYFGLELTGPRKEPPDHLRTELEFLHFLAFQEAQAAATGGDVEGLQKAQRDFLDRHPVAWVPLMRQRLVEQGAMPFFVEVTGLVDRYLQSESRRLHRELEAGAARGSDGHLIHA